PEVGDLSGLQLPDTVHGGTTGRLDRLTATQQLTLKAASVIGRVFALPVLRDVHPMRQAAVVLLDDLAALEAADLTALATPQPNLAYLFKHVITQEAAYDLMLVSQRRQLHRSVAEWYERTYAGALTAHAPLLAPPWQGGGVPDKAIGYLDQASTQALRAGAYQEAVRGFSRMLQLDARPRGPGASPPGAEAPTLQ